jgi:hypothetical protein
MSRTIRTAEIGWVIAGLRVLQNEIETATIAEDIAEIAGIGDAFPTSEALSALCERLSLSADQWVLVVGTVGNLDQIVGPFDTESDAREFAHGYSGEDRYDEWLSMPLTAPADEEDEGDPA